MKTVFFATVLSLLASLAQAAQFVYTSNSALTTERFKKISPTVTAFDGGANYIFADSVKLQVKAAAESWESVLEQVLSANKGVEEVTMTPFLAQHSTSALVLAFGKIYRRVSLKNVEGFAKVFNALAEIEEGQFLAFQGVYGNSFKAENYIALINPRAKEILIISVTPAK